MPAWPQCMMLHLQGYDFTICYHPGKEMVVPDMLSQFSPRPGPNLPLDIAIHHAHIMPNCKEAFQQAFVNNPEMHTLANLIITGWSEDIKEVPYPPPPILATQRDSHHWGWSCPVRWSTHHSSCQKGEGPASIASIPSRNNEVTVARTWKFLLAWHKQGHQRSSLPVWNLHPVPESGCCSTPHTYTITPMADVCHWYLHARRSWLPGSWQFLLKEDLHLMPSTWPDQCQQGCLTTENILRAWHPRSPSLWQWPTICECPVCQLLYILGYNTQNLKSALPAIQQICQGMCQVHQTCTPMSQIQWCQPTAHPASTPRHTHQHQASIPSGAIVPTPTQNNHSSQDMQQWPISHMSSWADQHMLRSHQITGWPM